MSLLEWENWARTERAVAARVVSPRSVEDVVSAMKRAASEGLRVKAVGSGHSFTGVAVTDGVRIRLDRLAGVIDVDSNTGAARVEAGMTLSRLNEVLWDHGLALSNLGDVDTQTVAGALSTGTHGTGARFGGLASQIRSLELVLADGSVVECSATERPDLFAAARVGLGGLGVITAVTVQCEPAYALHAIETPGRLSDVLDRFDELSKDNDHFEIPYWFPHTDRLVVQRNNRRPLSAGLRPLGRVRGWFDDEFLANKAFGVTQRLCARVPAAVALVNNASARLLKPRQFTDRSYRVFVSRRHVRFREMEYAVPRTAVVDVFRELADWFDRTDERISFPVEVRVAAADEIWLSTAYQRDTAYVAAHTFHRMPHERYFDAVEQIMTAVGGRPHWGKLHGLDATRLRALYPRFDDFVAVRREVDPAGRFANPYLDRVLGPAAD